MKAKTSTFNKKTILFLTFFIFICGFAAISKEYIWTVREFKKELFNKNKQNKNVRESKYLPQEKTEQTLKTTDAPMLELATGKIAGSFHKGGLANVESRELITVKKLKQAFYAEEKQGQIGASTDKEEDVIEDNFFKINIPLQLNQKASVFLIYDLYGLASHQSVSRSINRNPALGGDFVSLSLKWSSQKEEINPNLLKIGENSIQFTTATKGIKYKVRNVKIVFEQQQLDSSPFHVTSLRTEDKLYIKGFIRNNPSSTLTIQGNQIKPINGEFEKIIILTEQDKKNGVIQLLNNNELSYYPIPKADMQSKIINEEQVSARVFEIDKDNENNFEFGGASVNINKTTERKGWVKILKLRTKDFPSAGQGLRNITPQSKAFRINIENNGSEEKAKITIPYDEKRLGSFSPKEIKAFYFDYKKKQWIVIRESKVDEKSKTVSFESNGEGQDYINGVISVPESPQLNSFAPTTISGLKAGAPYAGLQMISPPIANQKGDAKVSYPLNIPSGINGLQPTISVNYSSNSGNGWMGEGWDISGLSEISIDTRWGSPSFNPQVETELYSLDGEMLVFDGNYLPHRHNDISETSTVFTTKKQKRDTLLFNNKKIFFLRKNHDFSKIERYGSTTKNYRWIVTDTKGTKTYYGGDENDVKQESVIKTDNGHIVRWGVLKIVDVYGNNIKFQYDNFRISNQVGENENLNGGAYFHIKNILYTGKKDNDGSYSVYFEREASISRPDISLNGKMGTKIVEPFKLKNIYIRYNGENIRKYHLEYGQGEFYKTILTALNEFDSDEKFINRHRFEYYNDLVTQSNASPINFGNEVNITAGGSDAFPSFVSSVLNPSKIAANTTFEWGIHGRIPGVGLDFLIPTPHNGYGHIMASFNIGHSEADAKKAQELMDFNGDGIIDLIYRKPNNGLFLREGNLSSGILSFGQQKQIQFLNSNFSRTKTKTNTIGYDAGINIFGIGFNWAQLWSTSKSDTSSFIIDANSDGIMDVAKDGEILFGRINPSNANVEMTRYSDKTENMVIVADAMTQHFSPLEGTWQDVIKNDVVKVWVASRDGTVIFTDNVSVENIPNAKAKYSVEMLSPTDPSKNVRIFLKEFTSTSGTQQITITKYNEYFNQISSLPPHNPNNHLAINNSKRLSVKSGDKIFVRLHKYENESFKVYSNPKIEYADFGIISPLLEQDGFLGNNGSYTDNYFLNNHTKPFTMNTAGNVSIHVPAVNFTSIQDKITFKILKVNVNNGIETVIHTQVRDQNNSNFNFSSFSTTLNVAQNEVPTIIRFVVETDSHQSFKNSNWNRIQISYPTGNSIVAAEYPSYYITEFKNKVNLQNYLSSYPIGLQDYKIGINKNISPNSGIPLGSFYYIVKNNGKVVTKRRIINTINGGGIVETDLVTNQTITDISPVTFHSGSNPESANLNILVFCHTKSDRDFFKAYSTHFQNKPFNIYYGANNAFLFNTNHTSINSASLENVSQFYHNWGQFLYNEFADVKPVNGPEGFMLNPETPSDEYGRLINNNAFKELDVPLSLSFPQCNNLPTQNETAQCIVNQINNGGMYQNPTNFVPQPIKPMETDIKMIKQRPVDYVEKWIGVGSEQYAMADSFKNNESSTGFFNPQTANPDVPDALTLQGDVNTRMFAINKKYYSKSRTNTLSGSLAVAGFVHANSKLVGDGSVTLQDFMDMNGDGYPDAMYKNAVQLSNSTGGHGALQINSASPYGVDFISSNDSYSNTVTPGPATGHTSQKFISAGVLMRNGEIISSPSTSSYTSSGEMNNGVESSPSWSGSASINYDSKDTGKSYWLDINGDGLSDKITGGGTTNMTYRLNMGYSMEIPRKFSNIETYTSGPVGSIGLSAGFNLQGLTNLPINVSASASAALGSSKTTFEDINGDGLIDILVIGSSTTHVKYNLGNKFANPIEIVKNNGGVDYNNESKISRGGVSLGGGYYYTIPIVWWPLPPIPLIYLKIGGDAVANIGLSIAEADKAFKDMNGDGFPDLVVAHNNGFKVNYSNIGRTNKLKTVIRTAGYRKDDWPFSKFELNYTSTLPSYNDAHPRLVLSQVTILNPDVMEGNHLISAVDKDMVTKFEYKNSRYDRREREFFGFEDVTTKEMNGTNIYRYSIQRFYNKGYFLNGLLKGAEDYSGSGTLLSKKENTFLLYKYFNNNTQINLSPISETFDTGGNEGRKMAIALLDNTKSIFYENGQNIETNTKMYYNNRSQLTKYQYSSPSSSYTSEITYHSLNNNILNVPRSISVLSGSGTGNQIRYRENIANINTGDITNVRVMLNSNEFAETSMEYDTYGNLIRITYPPNNNSSQKYSLSYNYDSSLNKYVVSVKDSFGVQSYAEYNPKFDVVTLTKDITGNIIKYTYDSQGRITSILAPKENGVNDYTVNYEYFIREIPYGQNGSFSLLRGARTKNYDTFSPDKMIETIVLEDGLGRMVQTKKDIDLGGSEKMSVSGRIVFDNLGRVIKTYHPMYENKYYTVNAVNNNALNTTLSAHFSSITYDVRNRVIQTTNEDGHISNNSFEISGGLSKTTSTQSQNASVVLKSELFTNAEGKTVKLKNYIGGNALVTSFDYNQIGELETVTDPQGLKTLYTYDFAGRKTQVNNPNHGVKTYRYSPAGQVISMTTSNLQNDPNISSNEINYKYDFNRLVSIAYPNLPNGNVNPSNVSYEYGGSGSGNNVSRIIHKIDGAAETWYEYGNMGEVISEKKKIFGTNIPAMTFLTRYNYDTWNRILDLSYYDGEKVRYTYDTGGNLKEIKGNDIYIKNIIYDQYGQRTSILYGNGTNANFQYALSNRRLIKHNLKDPYANNLLINEYKYDYVGNIIGISNSAGESLQQMGGMYSFTYNYDQQNRLANSEGNFSSTSSIYSVNNANFRVDLEYNMAGGITFKNQRHFQNQSSVPANTYQNKYFYTDNTHKIEHINNPLNGNEQHFHYDYNGNITRIIDKISGSESMFWDEEDRMKAYYNKDRGVFGYYTYDDKGDRVIKYNLETGTALYQNGALVDGSMVMTGYKIYPNPYLVINSEGNATKHYFAGTERIASRVGIFNSFMKESLPTQSPNSQTKSELAEEAFKTYLQKAGITENKIDTEFEKAPPSISGLYYMHGDHLGTATYVTEKNGKTTQFFLNLPFGETMAEQQLTGAYENPYKFNAKELDNETGLYYYGARYYNPKLSIWYSVDPLAEKLPHLSPYVFVRDNPVNRIDPDGRFDSWFGAFMHKTFRGHWGSKVQKNNNEKSSNHGKYYYTYDSSTKSGSTNTTENGQKVTNIAEVNMTTVYNTQQEKRTVSALRNTAEKLDYVAVVADVTAVALTPTTAGTGTVVAESVAQTASTASTGLNIYADLLKGHYKTALSRAVFYGVSAGISSKIQSWQKVIGKTSTTIMKGGNMLYDQTWDKAVEDYDKKTYPRELKPEDY